MKLARILFESTERLGVVDVEKSRVRLLDPSLRDMADLIERQVASGDIDGDAEPIPLDRVKVLAPIVPRRNVFCVGKNYREHAKEFAGSGYEAGAVKGAEIDEYPAVFSKPPSTIVADGDDVLLHSHVTTSVDYEAELAVVIGKGGRDIRAENALEHVWGYTIINDVTARDRQRQHKQWFLGKSLDTFCPMGPWITTADELQSDNLNVQCWVNGELRQNANTRDLIFGIPTLIATLSAGLELRPGDVIATGTPAGVGIGFTPPRFLKSGDEVRITIEGIGTLTNRFR
ncbi:MULTISPECIES: fumarylacetoacetate hydrolase family protein [Burkholderia]|uniref:fumarylacetoacetate hydrolase family protein n=1 Tax=Burkholderia TaxID=32008 RepID=UPI0007590059|nr:MULTISPECIES: fumarylacetoacetate hydrolase family protein [Burkholderia]KUZ34874.1 hydrolase [Burkholderia territorii]KUZ59685.1 hydrolase [Burkholderia territorii]KVC15899.1 hydrolase [Burkholderia diffusa]RQR32200.1 FAA hydrolase family protein [Burkholderia sp. Bp9131]RQR70808.1 FAA hydrolase family protein [Burkholderia sp. Bp9015]